MKRTLIAGLLALAALAGAGAQSFTLTNSFGANDDNTENGDFFEFERGESGYTNTAAHLDDVLDFAFSSEKFDGDITLKLYNSFYEGSFFNVLVEGFARYTPIQYVSLALGNDFGTEIAVDAAYLADADDTPTWGRMAQDGFAVTLNPISGLRIAGGVRKDIINFSRETVHLDFGAQYAMEDVFSVGVTALDVINDSRTFGLFGALNAVENLTLGAGVIYNADDEDFLPAQSNWAIQATAGYEFSDIGLALTADVVSGLVSSTDGVPFSAAATVSYQATDMVNISLAAGFTDQFGGGDVWETSVYPCVTVTLPRDLGDFDVGLRMAFDQSGLSNFSIPFTWTCTLLDI